MLVLVALACVSFVPAGAEHTEGYRPYAHPRATLAKLRESPLKVLGDVRHDADLRAQASTLLGLTVGLCIVPRTTGPDYNSFRTAEGWRQRLLSMRPIPFHQRLLMSAPFAMTACFLASDPQRQLALLRARTQHAASTISDGAARRFASIRSRVLPRAS